MFAGVWACYERAKRIPRSHPHKLIINQGRRERNIAAGHCINDSDPSTHGPLFRGGRRCLRCELVKRFGVSLLELVGIEKLARRLPGGIEHLRALEQRAA